MTIFGRRWHSLAHLVFVTLRHTHAPHALAGPAAMPAQMVQQNLGHSSLATTTLYIQTEKQARLQAMQKFWGRVG